MKSNCRPCFTKVLVLLSLLLASSLSFSPQQQTSSSSSSLLSSSTSSSNNVKNERQLSAAQLYQLTTTTTTTTRTTRKSPLTPTILLSLTLLMTGTFSYNPPVALAIEPTSVSSSSSFDPNVFTHDYDDPFHPFCKRHIQVSRDGKSFRYWGTAAKGEDVIGRGCSPQEAQTYGIRNGQFTGEIMPPGNRISAGDGIHEGVWEPAVVVAAADTSKGSTPLKYQTVDGIRWNDGNKWIVKEKKMATRVGEVIFWSYLGFSTLAGFKGIYDGYKRNKQKQQQK